MKGWIFVHGQGSAHYASWGYLDVFAEVACGESIRLPVTEWTPQQHAGRVKLCEKCKRWARTDPRDRDKRRRRR